MVNLSHKVKTQRAQMRGITMLELMIVVVIVGILAAFAYPSYREQVMRTHRADGKTQLMQMAQNLERCYTRFSAYNNVGCTTVSFPTNSAEGHYVVTASTLTATAYALDATPQAGQADDTDCAVLRLRSTGVQGSQGGDTDPYNCW
ncbi:MAG: type IV pilin protein [Gammaproteobacteria bacterium]